VVYNREEFPAAARLGAFGEPVHEVLIEQSVLGWKEYELEVMRDRADNFVIVCSIETLTPWASTPATASRWRRPRL